MIPSIFTSGGHPEKYIEIKQICYLSEAAFGNPVKAQKYFQEEMVIVIIGAAIVSINLKFKREKGIQTSKAIIKK